MAVKALRIIVEDKGAPGGARILKILDSAGRVPIKSSEMKAVHYFLYVFQNKMGSTISDADLVEIIASKDADVWRQEADQLKKGDKALTTSIALSMCWFRAAKPKKKAA